MSQTLDYIDRSSSNDARLKTSLLEWRSMLGNWRCLLVDYRSQLRQQASIREISEECKPADPRKEDVKELKTLYAILEKDCQIIEERVDRSFQVLMSTMSIIESKNAISQAESIGKLTELAFIFIPLSFVSSFFGMNVKVCRYCPQYKCIGTNFIANSGRLRLDFSWQHISCASLFAANS
jgi:Mg2+ and Co2+ transporter CorA